MSGNTVADTIPRGRMTRNGLPVAFTHLLLCYVTHGQVDRLNAVAVPMEIGTTPFVEQTIQCPLTLSLFVLQLTQLRLTLRFVLHQQQNVLNLANNTFRTKTPQSSSVSHFLAGMVRRIKPHMLKKFSISYPCSFHTKLRYIFGSHESLWTTKGNSQHGNILIPCSHDYQCL